MQIFAGKQFEEPIKIIEAFDNKSFIEAFSQIETLRKEYCLLGYIRYEAKEIFLGRKIESELPLLYFEVFEMRKETRDERRETGKTIHPFTCSRVHLIDYPTYAEAINNIKDEIACGNTYQVNYTYDYKIETEMDGFDLYRAILPNQTTPYNAYIKNDYEEILCFSPELFFELEGNKIKTKPMKGTVKRGETPLEDAENIEFLKNDIKNRAENVMIVDLLRNDLGKIAKTATVKVDKLFEVETHNTVHQMTSEVSAELLENTTMFEIFEAIFPCGSVTGTPKINTMEIIDKLEVGKRNVYCGAIGLITPEKTVFTVPIRILQRTLCHCEERGTSDEAIQKATGNATLNQVQGDVREYICRVGGAIVWDSTPEDEWEETLTKIKFLGQQKDFQLVETILVQDGQLVYGDEHFSRMEKSARELGFKDAKMQRYIDAKKNDYDYILRILINKEGDLKTQELPLDGIKTNLVTVSKTQINSKEPLLYHKTTYRPWYDETIEKIKASMLFDELFFNEKGELTEGARSNIVLQIDGELFTPPVECGLLNGVLR